MALEILLQNLSDDYKTDFFTTYFNSKYLNDKKSALKYLNFSSKSKDVELLDLYLKKRNKIFLDPILHKENKRLLTQHFFNIWHIDMSFFHKKKLIECIAPVTEEIIGFIKQNEVDLYFYLQLTNKNVTKEDLIERFTNCSEEKRHFYIWQASKFLNFDKIEDAIKKYIN